MANKTAIRKLIRTIKKLEPAQCDMDDWGYNPRGLPERREDRGVSGCGTTACIAGWAALTLAPTKPQPLWNKSALCLLVNEKWAARHGLDATDKCGTDVLVEADEIARAVLGLTAGEAQLFYETPSVGETDKDWMLRTLKERFL